MKLHPTGRFDNAAHDYQHIQVKPIAAAMGAEILGVQASELSDEAFAEVEDALYRHKMIAFRDQELTPADQEAFTLRLGDFGVDAYTTGSEGHQNVQPVVKEADTEVPMIFGSGWHTDSPFLERPPSISTLFGVDIPPYGGDTLFANAVLAYETLSETMRELLASLRVHMTAQDVLSVLAVMNTDQDPEEAPKSFGNIELDVNQRQMAEGSFHPLIRTHPKTGQKALFVDVTYARGIEGLRPAEAEPLLGFLQDHVTQPAMTCRLRWSNGTFALWDNRLCVHQAFNDHDGFRREMRRTTVLGEVPS